MAELSHQPSNRDIADWLLATLRIYGADEANAHRIVALFMEALDAPRVSEAA